MIAGLTDTAVSIHKHPRTPPSAAAPCPSCTMRGSGAATPAGFRRWRRAASPLSATTAAAGQHPEVRLLFILVLRRGGAINPTCPIRSSPVHSPPIYASMNPFTRPSMHALIAPPPPDHFTTHTAQPSVIAIHPSIHPSIPVHPSRACLPACLPASPFLQVASVKAKIGKVAAYYDPRASASTGYGGGARPHGPQGAAAPQLRHQGHAGGAGRHHAHVRQGRQRHRRRAEFLHEFFKIGRATKDTANRLNIEEKNTRKKHHDERIAVRKEKYGSSR